MVRGLTGAELGTILDSKERRGEMKRNVRDDREFWYCNVCDGQNSRLDGECQWCDCGGKDCKRDNCSGPQCGQQEIEE